MKFKFVLSVMILSAMLAIPAAAQQDPLDQGAADSAMFVISEPVVGAIDQIIRADLYFFNDVQNMGSMSSGYGWDNPNVEMDSAVFSTEATAAFNLARLTLYRNNLDSTNASQLFQCTGLRMFGDGLAASGSPKLVASYFFHVPTWSETDAFCIDLADFTGFGFVDLSNNEYRPIYDGPFCVGTVIDGVLEVAPESLDFNGVVGEPNPASQAFTVSEATDDNIPYTASLSPLSGTSFEWVSFTNGEGTTPGEVTVNIDVTGLTPGNWNRLVYLNSSLAVNQAVVEINLNLQAGNQAPVLDPIGNQTTGEDAVLQFTVTASDPDMDALTLTSSTLPGSATFTDNGDGTGLFHWVTNYDDAGFYDVTFYVSDGDLTDQELITIEVINLNRAPVLNAIGNRQVLEGANLNFTVSGFDPDLDAITFSTDVLPGTASFVDNGDGTATFDWTPGNTDAGIYPVTFMVTDGDLTDFEVVSIEVIDADGFILAPNTVAVSSNFGGGDPADETIAVSISDGSMIGFTVEETATWFTVDPMAGTTPATLTLDFETTGLAAGFYRDSIMISGGELDPVYGFVELTIVNNLAVAPTELAWTISEGDLVPAEANIDVTEMGGDAIAFEAVSDAAWLTIAGGTGTTPGSFLASVAPANNPGPGDYTATITVTGAAANSPIEIPVSLTVTACPVLAPAMVVYNEMAFAGETVMFDETIPLTSSGPGEIDWVENVGSGSPFAFTPTEGTTPGDVAVHYERLFDVQGVFADTAYLAAVETELYACPSQVMIITNVTVNRPPSADTVIVVNTPAVPGMRVGVPVIFTNSCPLNEIGLSLSWTGGMHLDSVSFAGSVVGYVENKVVTIDNDLFDVSITATVGSQMMVPIGSEQTLATLFFALPCEIEDGTYGFTLGEVHFLRDCGEGEETEYPEYIPGSVIVGSASNFVCGYVVDPSYDEIEGATVELWSDYPFTEPLMATMSSGIGSFAFDEIMVIPFDLYAYKEGYYPGKVEDINFGDKGIIIVLEPLPETVTPTSEWVDYYCPDMSNMFLGALVPVGAVVEAYTPTGVLAGQKMVTTTGQYGFMPVYRASTQFGDDGATTGEMIRFTINGMDAIADGNTMYPAEYAQMEVCLEVRGTVEKECTLFEGWNLVSWNVNTATDDILTVLAPVMGYVDVVLGFEQGGLTFDPDLQAFSTLWDVDHYSGYWIRIEGISEVTLAVSGLPVMETTPIALTTGWNLVSYLPEESMPTASALATVSGVMGFAYGFPGGQIQVWEPDGSFNQLETFEPCNGYWIKTTADTWLTYNAIVTAPAAPRPQISSNALSSRVATTNWVNLYAQNLTVDGEQVPTGATITARSVANDNLLGSFTMATDGRFGFMPVYADAAGDNVTGLNVGDEFYLEVNEVATEEVFTWTSHGDRIEVGSLSTANSIGDVLPQGYSLAQNYPNPFNPNTTISFATPTAGHVKIEVFNVLGRSIAVILDGQVPAGENSVVWDGNDSEGTATASGVYFYRLTADNYTETRKMMLLK